MKIIFTILVATLILPTSLISQTVDLPSDYVRNTITGKNNIPENVEGSPYMNDDFKPGKIDTGDKIINSPMRYNIYQDEFQIANGETEIIALRRTPNLKIELQGKKFAIYGFNGPTGNKQGYFEELYSSENISILKRHEAEFTEAKKAANSYASDTPAKFKPSETYYIKVGANSAEEVDLKKKDVLNAINDDKVEKYIKQNKLKFKDESDLIKVAQYYDSSLK